MKLTPLAIVLLGFSLCRAAEPLECAGKWSIVDEKSGGMTRIEISRVGKVWKIRAWAAVTNGENDFGATTLSFLGDEVYCPRCVQPPTPTIADLREGLSDPALKTPPRPPDLAYGFAHWDFKFKDTYFTVKRERENLVVEEFNIFKDDSERTNYRLRYLLQRSK